MDHPDSLTSPSVERQPELSGLRDILASARWALSRANAPGGEGATAFDLAAELERASGRIQSWLRANPAPNSSPTS